jgi:hypothetical protein
VGLAGAAPDCDSINGQLTLGPLLGAGTYGLVHRAYWQGSQVAVKSVALPADSAVGAWARGAPLCMPWELLGLLLRSSRGPAAACLALPASRRRTTGASTPPATYGPAARRQRGLAPPAHGDHGGGHQQLHQPPKRGADVHLLAAALWHQVGSWGRYPSARSHAC